MSKLLEVKNLQVSYHTYAGEVQSVRGIDFEVNHDEVLAIVGESGCGKSVTSRALMGLIAGNGEVKAGSQILFEGKNILKYSKREILAHRGKDVAMIFQDALVSLNPTMKVGKQIMESLQEHLKLKKREAKEKAIELLYLVGIPEPQKRIEQYPHEFSGGMRQRVMIAMALACQPKLLIADEPTTSLDVTIQAQILELMKKIQAETGTAIILITHDLGIVSEVADRIAVMYLGKIVETGRVAEIFSEPKHPYTISLLNAVPRADLHGQARLTAIKGTPPDLIAPPNGCPFSTRCNACMPVCRRFHPEMSSFANGHQAACWLYHPMAPEVVVPELVLGNETEQDRSEKQVGSKPIFVVDGVKKYFNLGRGSKLLAVDDVDLVIREGETVGLVGESGCGKTTLGRTIIGMLSRTEGTVTYYGKDVHAMQGAERKAFTKEVQVILQDPYTSLDPRMTVADIVAEGIDIHKLAVTPADRRRRIFETLAQVGLNSEHANRFPHEFSGGQRQRIGIARALAVNPSFMLLDEPISALDVSIQAQVINLLIDLQQEHKLTYLFIAHDLSMVRHMSDQIAVMYMGKIVEQTTPKELYAQPLHPYTQALLSAIPEVSPQGSKLKNRIMLEGEVSSPINPKPGCRFYGRCRYATTKCNNQDIKLREVAPGHSVACVLHT